MLMEVDMTEVTGPLDCDSTPPVPVPDIDLTACMTPSAENAMLGVALADEFAMWAGAQETPAAWPSWGMSPPSESSSSVTDATSGSDDDTVMPHVKVEHQEEDEQCPTPLHMSDVTSYDQSHLTSRQQRESNLRQFALSPDEPVPDSLEKLSDNQLAMIDFKILMQLMEKAGLSPQQIAEVKSRRRRLKNRLSARVCSNKKREKCSELEDTNRGLMSTLRKLTVENQRLKEEQLKLQEANTSLTKSSFDAARENAMLRAQIEHLTQMLSDAGLMGASASAASAAFAA